MSNRDRSKDDLRSVICPPEYSAVFEEDRGGMWFIAGLHIKCSEYHLLTLDTETGDMKPVFVEPSDAPRMKTQSGVRQIIDAIASEQAWTRRKLIRFIVGPPDRNGLN